MPLRTNGSLVVEVLSGGGDYDTELTPSLDRYIKIASLLVDKVSSCAIAKGDPQSDEVLTELETWLAAHYYVQSDQQYASKSTDGASGSFRSGATSEGGVAGSGYGRAALDLDFSGCLKAITTQRRAGGMWGGKPKSSQLDYHARGN